LAFLAFLALFGGSVPGVNQLGTYGRWAIAEFSGIYEIESEFKGRVEGEFNKMITTASQDD
jgi:type III restriction enzyme